MKTAIYLKCRQLSQLSNALSNYVRKDVAQPGSRPWFNVVGSIEPASSPCLFVAPDLTKNPALKNGVIIRRRLCPALCHHPSFTNLILPRRPSPLVVEKKHPHVRPWSWIQACIFSGVPAKLPAPLRGLGSSEIISQALNLHISMTWIVCGCMFEPRLCTLNNRGSNFVRLTLLP